MSLLSHYSSKRNSSLSLFSPQTSPIRHLFKRTPSMRYAQLKPMEDSEAPDEEKDKNEDTKNQDNKETDKKNSKNGKKKDNDQEPICDLDDLTPGINANANKVHSNIELPSLPALPSTPGSSNYTNLLEKKINLIMIELDFSDPQGDVAAKEIRLNALNEILSSISNNNCDKLTNQDQEILYSGFKKLLFKELGPIMPQFQFCDDLVVLLDGSWEQTKIGYQILSTYILWSISNPSKSIVKLSQGKDLKDILRLIFRQFNKFDLNERTALIDILVQMISKDPKNITPEVLQKTCHMISSYLDKCAQPYVLMPTVAILNYIFKFGTPLEKVATTGGKDPNHKESTSSMSNIPTVGGASNPGNTVSEANVAKYEDVYLQYVLPLLGALHFPTCSDNMFSIVDQFVKGSPNLVMPTITELVRHFPITRSVKTITFLKMLTVSMTKMNVRDFKKNMKLLFHLFVKCTTGPQVKVSDASLGVWHKIELEPLIMDNAKILFPFVYPMLSKGMRENWSQDIISNIDDIFQTMNRIDSFIFQELCRQKQPQQATMNGNDHLKTWAVIARLAAKTDKTLNLATKLAEIQRVFAVQQVQQTSQPNQPKNRSATNLASSGTMMNIPRANRSGSSLPKNSPLPPFKGP